MNGDDEQHKSGERIAKVIARAGLASRREAEAWIEAGRVAVNGEPIRSPALDVTPRDRITVDGAPLPARERTRLFLYHKPRGLMTTHADPQGRSTIFERLPQHLPRLISVGRLDFNTEGLLLLTNDGALARVLELPATGWLRRYRVRAHGSITQDKLDALRKGVTISGIHYGAIDASIDRAQGSNLWLTFAIREGKNREVRNVLGHLELTVTRLIRVSFGPFQLGEIDVGAVEEVPTRVLRDQLGDKLIAQSEADFSGPVAAPPPPPRPDDAAGPMRPKSQMRPKPRRRDDAARATRARPQRRDEASVAAQPKPADAKSKNRKSTDHAWRAREEERPTKLLRRKFRGARLDATRLDGAPADGERPNTGTRERPSGEKRAGLLRDRKGRRLLVERYGQPPAKEAPRPRKPPEWETRKREAPKQEASKRDRHSRRRSPDRAFGARPSKPRGR
jgi:23S rRNA pseudouridine2605 synthase